MTLPDPRTPHVPGPPQPPTGWNSWPPPPPQGEQLPPDPAPKKHTARNVALAVTGAVVLAVCGLAGIGALVGGNDTTTGVVTTRDPTPAAATAAPTPTGELGVATPEPAQAAVLTKADVHLTVKITRQKCFGSAGCNVTYTVEAGWPGDLVAIGDTYLVTYEVWPVEDGPAINSLTIMDADQYESDSAETASTTRRVKSLKIKVTDVERIGS
jgi:hypothetical protein